MIACQLGHTELNIHFSENKGKHVAQEDNALVIGYIMYLTNCTRPDIVCTCEQVESLHELSKLRALENSYEVLEVYSKS